MPDAYVAWLAGFVDGEGSIMVWVSLRTTVRGRPSLQIVPAVTITQHVRARAVLENIQRTLGYGRVYDRDLAGRHGSPKSHWQPTNREEVRAVLQTVLPHLRVKRRQAEAALRALDILEQYPRAGVNRAAGHRQLPEAAVRELVGIALDMNPKSDGSRYHGKDRASMDVVIDALFPAAEVH